MQVPQTTSETFITLSDGTKQGESKCYRTSPYRHVYVHNSFNLSGLSYSCPHQEGQRFAWYFIHVKPLFKAYSLGGVGHGSSCKSSMSARWAVLREVISESTSSNVGQGNYGCLRTMKASAAACRDASYWHGGA